MKPSALLAIGAAASLGACATTPKSCRGLAESRATVVLANGHEVLLPSRLAEASLPELQCGVDQGLPAAQVALGNRYETGNGVPQDLDRAMDLYGLAAVAVPPTTAIYSPPVTLGGRGQVLLLDNPNAGPGSAEAQYRLARLLSARSDAESKRRAQQMLDSSAKQGYVPALEATKSDTANSQ